MHTGHFARIDRYSAVHVHMHVKRCVCQWEKESMPMWEREREREREIRNNVKVNQELTTAQQNVQRRQTYNPPPPLKKQKTNTQADKLIDTTPSHPLSKLTDGQICQMVRQVGKELTTAPKNVQKYTPIPWHTHTYRHTHWQANRGPKGTGICAILTPRTEFQQAPSPGCGLPAPLPHSWAGASSASPSWWGDRSPGWAWSTSWVGWWFGLQSGDTHAWPHRGRPPWSWWGSCEAQWSSWLVWRLTGSNKKARVNQCCNWSWGWSPISEVA